MADRVYPASKPNPQPPQALNGTAAGARGGAPPFPPTKSQMYGGATRPAYRPMPPKPRRRSRRSCCCACCLWLTLFIIAIVLIAAIAGGVVYVLYRPQRPSFTVSTLHLSALNVTASGQISSRLDLAVTARNPNKKIAFLYGASSVSVSSGGVPIGEGSLPAFIQGAKNITVLKSTASSSGQTVDSSAASDLRKKKNLPIEIQVETRAGVKIAGMKTSKIGIRVTCDGITLAVPKPKANSTAVSPDARCKVKLRIKIWKWTI